MFCSLNDLDTESDVEKKLVMPLLTIPPDRGLGYLPSDIKTQATLKKLLIDKGKSEKLYRPDFAIVIAGVPFMLIEVKKPGEDCLEALRQARMYAAELNAGFPTGINPVRRVMACNGEQLLCSFADTSAAELELTFNNINATDVKFSRLQETVGRVAAQEWADSLAKHLTKRPLHRAANLVGGQTVRDEDIGYNDFGSKLALDYRSIFTPDSRKDRAQIVRNAYVSSERREHYVDEIDRVIKTAVVSTIPGSKLIESTGTPREILAALRKGRKLENEIMLLVGGRGTGKTTFIDYCRLVKLPEPLLNETVWVHLNYYDSPPKGNVQDWLLTEFITRLKDEHPEFDFDELATIEKLYGVELRKFKATLSLLDANSEAYKVRLTDRIIALQGDSLATAKAMSRFLCGDRNKLLVVVFDNSDKRNKTDQLLAFENARWLQAQVPCLIILPIRDITYDLCKDELPLDTAIKDLVFRIEPPPFSKVLRKRIDLVLSDLQIKSGCKMLDLTLASGHKVLYPASEMGYYLASIYKSLYEYDKIIRSLLLGLAGRDLRRAMEIFLEFCRSGHIDNVQYLIMKTQRGHYSLPYEVVTRVLLRRNRRFYSGDHSFVANLFQCDDTDVKPDSFVRVAILAWLFDKLKEVGPKGVRGFFRFETIASDLVPLGHELTRIRKESSYLIKFGCIVTEHQRPVLETDSDLLRISPSGTVHLQMTADPAYLAACAEDTWVTDLELAQATSVRMAKFGPSVHFSPVTMMINAKEFVRYLLKRTGDELAEPNVYLEHPAGDARTLVSRSAAKLERAYETFTASGSWETLENRFHVDMQCDGVVTGVQTYGAFIKLDGGPTGLLHVSNLPRAIQLDSVKVGDRFRVSIKYIDYEGRKISLMYVDKLPDDLLA